MKHRLYFQWKKWGLYTATAVLAMNYSRANDWNSERRLIRADACQPLMFIDVDV